MSMSAGPSHRKRPSKADNSNPHANLHQKQPKQVSLSAISDASGLEPRNEGPPLSDRETDFDRVQSQSSDILSSSNESRRENQWREIHSLRLEVAALKVQQEQYVLSESLRAEMIMDLKKKSEVYASCARALGMELKRTKAIHEQLKEHLQCQICLEMLQSPWTLVPCGHVGCLECLTRWFVTPGLDDDPDDPTEVFYRQKTCPQCRAVIESPPTPSYILKNLVNEMQSVGSNASSPRPLAPIVNTADPWAGIFTPLEGWQDEDEEDAEAVENSDGGDGDSLSSDSPSESSEYRVEHEARREHLEHLMEWEIDLREQATVWTEATWQPPRFNSGVTELSTDDRAQLGFLSPSEILSLLRRGATMAMIELFKLSYDHQLGIIAAYANGTVIRLGWNLSRSSNDPDGRIFMAVVINELTHHSERFRVEAGLRGEPIFVRLVPSRGEPGDDEDVDGS